MLAIPLIDRKIKQNWEEKATDQGIQVLANLRAIYQDEVDNLMYDEVASDLRNRVRTTEGFPNPRDLREITYSLWVMVGTAVNITIMKFSGLILLELAVSKSENEFLKRTIRALLQSLFDPDRIDIAHVQWGLAHDPNWDLFDRLEILRSVLNIEKPDIFEYYGNLAEQCVQEYGRGILYENS